jgi:hypothetical protein
LPTHPNLNKPNKNQVKKLIAKKFKILNTKGLLPVT